MSTVMKLIPFHVYEELLESGVLEKYFPQAKLDPLEQFTDNVPLALRERATKILKLLTKSGRVKFDQDQLVYEGEKFENSINLLNKLLLGSTSFSNLEGSQAFLKALKEENVPSYLYVFPKLPDTKESKSLVESVNILEPSCIEGEINKVVNKKLPTAWIRFEDRFTWQ